MPAGRPRIYNTEKQLEEACDAYFTWCDSNPWVKNELVRGGDLAGKIIPVPTARPYTIRALCAHIGISRETWYKLEKNPEFSDITTRVHDKIYNQKFEGATVGAFNGNIIARELGLSENVSVHTEQPLFPPVEVQVKDLEPGTK